MTGCWSLVLDEMAEGKYLVTVEQDDIALPARDSIGAGCASYRGGLLALETAMSRIRHVAFPALCALLALGAARAQSPASVTKAIKAAAKAELKLLRADLAEHVAEFDAAVDAFEEALLVEDPDLVTAVQDLGAVWGGLQLAGMQKITDRQSSFAIAAGEVLSEFQAAEGALGPPYPAGCHAGDGGGVDAWIAGWPKEKQKAHEKMEGRLLKARKLLEKKAGLQVGVQTRVPVFHAGLSFNADLDSADSDSTTLFAFGVDLLLTLDPVDGSGDAVVLLTGMGFEGDSVDVVGEGSNGVPNFANVSLVDAGSRWLQVYPNVSEGNYLLSIANLETFAVLLESLGVG